MGVDMSEGRGARGKEPGGPGAAREIKVRLTDEVARGVYANSMMVQHTREEVVMDFALVVGSGGSVVARVISSPAHAKRILAALQDNLAKYEAAYGRIQPTSEPATRVGFQPSPEG
ncbi:MAG: hypothetical protein Kow00122_01880 [Thermoleophilia bacterium]